MKPRRQARISRGTVVFIALCAAAVALAAAVLHYRAARAPQPPAATALAPSEPGGKTRGRADAPVTIEVFSDFL